MTLLQQTVKELEENGKDLRDIKWVGCREFKIPLDDFIRLADVPCSQDSIMTPTDLLIVGDDFYMERFYDYEETNYWEFKKIIKEPETVRTPKALVIPNIGAMLEPYAEILLSRFCKENDK